MIDLYNPKFSDSTVDLTVEVNLSKWKKKASDREALVKSIGEKFVSQMESKLKEHGKYRRYSQYKKEKEIQFCWPIKIIVKNQSDKDELLLAFKYIHDLNEIDTDIIAINALMHMYQSGDMIEIDPDLKDVTVKDK